MRAFTAVANELLDHDALPRLTQTELLLLLVLARLTTGYQRDSITIGETKLLEKLRTSSSSFYRAKRALSRLGLIEVWTEGDTCTYRLKLQPEAGDTPVNIDRGVINGRGVTSDRGGLSLVTGGSPAKNDRGTIKKEDLKKTSKETSPSLELSVSPACGDDDVFSISEQGNEPSASDAETAPEIDQLATLTRRCVRPLADLPSQNGVAAQAQVAPIPPAPRPEAEQKLWDGMMSIRVSEHIAERALREYPLGAVAQALKSAIERFRRGEIDNPAGWFWRELQAGGFGPTKAALLANQRERAANRRKAERERHEEQREQADQAARARVASIEAAWSPEYHAELIAEARRRTRRPTAAADDAMIRAMTIAIDEERRTT